MSGPLREPVLSVVLAGHDLEETRLVRRAFAGQTIASRLELVLVLPRGVIVDEPGLFDAFHRGRVVEVERISSRGLANAAGVRAARAPVVALAEDHAFPAPDWAEALVHDHQRDCAAVAPRVANANPATATSWADFVIGYGPWATSAKPGERPFLPGHNSSYKLDLLRRLSDEELDEALHAETLLHWKLADEGRRLLLSENALIHHVNFSRPGAFYRAQLIHGRSFAGLRARSWGPMKRLLYALGSPLIPLVRAWRLRAAYGRSGSAPWWSLPSFVFGLALDGLAQGVGYLFGPGDHQQELTDCEFARVRYVIPGDREVIAALAGAS